MKRVYCILLIGLLLGACREKAVENRYEPKLVLMPDDKDVFFRELGFSYSTLEEAEHELISRCSSLLGASKMFYLGNKLESLVLHDSATLTYDFAEIQQNDYVSVLTSEDGNLRLYYWNSEMGGSMIDWVNLCQFRSNNKVYVYTCGVLDLSSQEEEWEYLLGCAVLNLYTIYAKNGEVYYLAHVYVKESGNLGWAGIVPMKIEDDELKILSFFDEPSDEFFEKNATYREYRIADWYFRSNLGEGWTWMFKYDKTTQTLYVPEVVDLSITDRYSLYMFDGEKFVYMGDDGGYWLHPDIRDFEQLEILFCTKDYKVRVDMMPNGTYRYASWKKEVSMSHRPDIIIYDGFYREEENAYVFQHNGFRYVVYPGSRDSKLRVFQGKKQLLYQEQLQESH